MRMPSSNPWSNSSPRSARSSKAPCRSCSPARSACRGSAGSGDDTRIGGVHRLWSERRNAESQCSVLTMLGTTGIRCARIDFFNNRVAHRCERHFLALRERAFAIIPSSHVRDGTTRLEAERRLTSARYSGNRLRSAITIMLRTRPRRTRDYNVPLMLLVFEAASRTAVSATVTTQAVERTCRNRQGQLLQSYRCPPTSGTRAIAGVLSDMDAEIAALEAKLAKARQLKQGMMQELLTGRIRLV